MKKYMKYSFLAFFLILLVLSFFIVRPFLTAILAGIIVAYVFFPAFRLLKNRTGSHTFSAIIIMIVVLILIGSIAAFIGTKVFREVNKITNDETYQQAFDQLNSKCDQSDSWTCKSIDYINRYFDDPDIQKNIKSFVSRISASVLISLPELLLNIIVFIFTTFYLLRDGTKMMEYLGAILPLKHSFKKSLNKQIKDLFYSTVYGAIVVAIIQGAVGTVAFIVFGSTESPFFWGTIMAVAALIPFIGTGIIWLPMSVFQILLGYLNDAPSDLYKGIGLLLFGALIISSIDNVLKPKIIGDRAGMHPLLIMIGAFGGIAFMGFIGVFAGPMILAFFMSFLRVYHKEKTELFEE